MRIGVTGHQHHPGIDWAWVGRALSAQLADLPGPIEGFSCLAAGADQVFARAVVELGGRLFAVIPFAGYERTFEPEAADGFRRLVRVATETFELEHHGDPAEARYQAGRYVADSVHLLFAVWDGAPARARGDTAEIVAYARGVGTPVVQLEPIERAVRVV